MTAVLLCSGALVLPGTAVALAETSAPVAAITTAAIPPSCNINDNLGLTADQFISKCVKASVRREFPSGLLGASVENIRVNRSLNSDYKKAWKLISQLRFRK